MCESINRETITRLLREIKSEYTVGSDVISDYIMKHYCLFSFVSATKTDDLITDKPDVGPNLGTMHIKYSLSSEKQDIDIPISDEYFDISSDYCNIKSYPTSYYAFVLEYVEFGLSDAFGKEFNITQLIDLLFGYMIGIHDIFHAGYTHFDIKPDNLRFSYSGTIGDSPVSKIIDLALIKHDKPMEARSPGFMNAELIEKISEIEKNIENGTGNISDLKIKKLDLLSRYDISALAISMLKLKLFERKSDAIHHFLEKCAEGKYTIDNAIVELLDMSRSGAYREGVTLKKFMKSGL